MQLQIKNILSDRNRIYFLFELAFLAGIFFFCVHWAHLLPLDAGPDERMRYDIPQYIYEHGKLPHGGDPSIRNPIWGTSYGISYYIILHDISPVHECNEYLLHRSSASPVCRKTCLCLFYNGSHFLCLSLRQKVI